MLFSYNYLTEKVHVTRVPPLANSAVGLGSLPESAPETNGKRSKTTTESPPKEWNDSPGRSVRVPMQPPPARPFTSVGFSEPSDGA
jgi:hypothetical protein